MRRRLPLVGLALVVGTIAIAQTVMLSPVVQGSPLRISEISVVSAEADQNAHIVFKVQNQSGKPIEAYGLVATRANSSGKTLADTTRLRLVSLLPGEKAIAPKETVSDKIVVPAGDSGDVSVTVDYVLFKDGTTWGSDTMHFSEAVMNLRAGAKLYQHQAESAASKPK